MLEANIDEESGGANYNRLQKQLRARNSLEHFELCLVGHGVHEGLVAVAQIRGEPPWVLCDASSWPLAVVKFEWGIWGIFATRILAAVT